jgi:hypothetical protein
VYTVLGKEASRSHRFAAGFRFSREKREKPCSHLVQQCCWKHVDISAESIDADKPKLREHGGYRGAVLVGVIEIEVERLLFATRIARSTMIAASRTWNRSIQYRPRFAVRARAADRS